MWVAVLLMCTTPSALSCQIVAKPEPFYTEEACKQETIIVTNDLIAKGIYAVPICVEIGTNI
jgi:hypothetical protein